MADVLSTMTPQIDATKRAQLEAAATGGSAGVAAFKEGQAALGAERQAAVGRAASRAALIGGPEAQGFEALPDQYYGRGIANLGTAQSTFEADMARRLAANQNYLSQAAASIPAYRAETDRIVGLKKASEEVKAAKAEKDALSKISITELLGLANQAKSIANAEVSNLAQVDPSKGNLNQQAAAALAAGGPTASGSTLKLTSQPLQDIAMDLGRKLGVSNITLAGLYAPSTLSGIQSANENLAGPKAPEDAVAKALATKYDTKGVTYDTAKSVLNNVDFQGFVRWIMSGAPGPDGKPLSREDVQDSIYQKFIAQDGRNWTAEYNILIGEYLPLIAASAGE